MLNIFGKTWCSSGARGFFGEGYWYSGNRLDNTILVAKTTTYEARKGNMPLNGIKPKEWKPKCIKINFKEGAVLNAVGLSGPGAEVLFEKGIWQSRLKPTILSFMSVHADLESRLSSLQKYCILLNKQRFNAPIALQINFSCPNANLDPDSLITDMQQSIKIANMLCLPIIPKINCLVDPLALKNIKGISALCVSNTIPWGKLPDQIPWERLFGSISPLYMYGGGGLSGNSIIPPLLAWLNKSKLPYPIVCTTGQSQKHVHMLKEAGVTYFEVGTVNLLRPWRVKGIIKCI